MASDLDAEHTPDEKQGHQGGPADPGTSSPDQKLKDLELKIPESDNEVVENEGR